MNETFAELLHEGHAQSFSVRRVLVDEQSKYQRIFLFENDAFGRVLALDGIVQITERDEASYSEMLVHPPVFEHGAIRCAMIAGGGDGAVAKEILKHDSIETVDLVDIDPRVVENAREHLGNIHEGAFENSRLSIHAQDAFSFLEECEGRYDLIIADRPDPVGPAAQLFGSEFYRRVASALRKSGIATFQTGAPFFQAEELREAVARMRTVWSSVATYLTVTPTYTGGFFALTRGSNVPLTTERMEEAMTRARTSEIITNHYTPELHRASYAHPKWIADLVA